MGNYWHLYAKNGSLCTLAKKVLVALVVRVRNECYTSRHQLGSCGFDEDLALWTVKAEAVVCAWHLPILKLCLGDSSAEGYVPEGRCHREVSLTPAEVIQKSLLGDPLGLLADRAITLAPVNREPEVAPKVLESLLVLLS